MLVGRLLWLCFQWHLYCVNNDVYVYIFPLGIDRFGYSSWYIFCYCFKKVLRNKWFHFLRLQLWNIVWMWLLLSWFYICHHTEWFCKVSWNQAITDWSCALGMTSYFQLVWSDLKVRKKHLHWSLYEEISFIFKFQPLPVLLDCPSASLSNKGALLLKWRAPFGEQFDPILFILDK